MTKLSSITYSLLIFNYSDSDVLTLTFRLEDGERRPQPHSGEYYCLGPDLTENTRRRYILIFAAVLITLTRMVYRMHAPLLSQYNIIRLLRGGYYNLNTTARSVPVYDTPPHD